MSPSHAYRVPTADAIEYIVDAGQYLSHDSLHWGMEERLGMDWRRFATDSAAAFMARERCIAQYGFAVPTEEALDVITDHAPIVEIGAGAGYWAYLLRKRGVDIAAYDIAPPPSSKAPHGFMRPWTDVQRGGPKAIRNHPFATLFLCWPPLNSPMARRCLSIYQRDVVLYVGEWYGCTADDKFHALLERDFDEERVVDIPQWFGMHDRLFIRRRKKAP